MPIAVEILFRDTASVSLPGIAFDDSRPTFEGPAGLTVNIMTARRSILIGELPHNSSRSATNMAEDLAPELIQRHFPQRSEELPPAIFLEHYVEERTPGGRLGRKSTWDRLSFHSWAPRRVWLSGQERIAFGDPHWEHLPEHEVEALLGREEMQALPQRVLRQDNQP